MLAPAALPALVAVLGLVLLVMLVKGCGPRQGMGKCFSCCAMLTAVFALVFVCAVVADTGLWTSRRWSGKVRLARLLPRSCPT